MLPFNANKRKGASDKRLFATFKPYGEQHNLFLKLKGRGADKSFIHQRSSLTANYTQPFKKKESARKLKAQMYGATRTKAANR